MTPSPHSEHVDTLRRFLGWKAFVEYGEPEHGDVPPSGPIPEEYEAVEALNGLEEQLEAARVHLTNALNVAHPITGDDHDRMDEANRWLDAPNPASRAGTSSAEGTNEANAAGPGVSSPAKRPS